MAFGTLGINSGTQNAVPVDTITGTNYPVMKLDVGAAGATSPFTGTFFGGTLNVGTINTGTVVIPSGTVNVGTFVMPSGTVTSVTNLAAGTIQENKVPVVIGTSYGTLGTTGAAVIGTLVAASGAGTKQYISGLSIVVAAGTVDCAITNVGTIAGPSGVGVLARGQFTPGGGIRASFNPVSVSGTNGTVGYWMGGAGTAYFTVDYWQGV